MQIIINEEKIIIEKEKVFIPDLLVYKSIHDLKGLAVAVNNSIVSKEQWNSTPLKENDKILIIRATQGG
jgi:sulfur carrier protein